MNCQACIHSSGEFVATWHLQQRGICFTPALPPPCLLPPQQSGMVDGVVVADGLMWALLPSRTEASTALVTDNLSPAKPQARKQGTLPENANCSARPKAERSAAVSHGVANRLLLHLQLAADPAL